MTTTATPERRLPIRDEQASAPLPTAPRHRGTPSRIVGYLLASLRYAVSDGGFVGFIIAMPAGMYLFFSALYGDVQLGNVAWQQHIMVMMATYGAMGSALSAGNAIQTERSTGWFRQLMLTSLTPTQFFVTRTISALLLILPPVVVVLAIGAVDGVELPITTWLSIVGVSLIVLIPFVVMGMVAGLLLKPRAANAATTFLMLSMAMLGGMWVPLEQMPEMLQDLGRLLPSYWAADLSLLPITGEDIPVRGVVTLLAWTIGLTVLGVLGYRRAVATSKR